MNSYRPTFKAHGDSSDVEVENAWSTVFLQWGMCRRFVCWEWVISDTCTVELQIPVYFAFEWRHHHSGNLTSLLSSLTVSVLASSWIRGRQINKRLCGLPWIQSSKSFAMVQELQESIWERSQIPLEILCASGLVCASSFRSVILNETIVPFKLCDHVYAKPPARVHMAVCIFSLMIFMKSSLSVLTRLLDVLFRRDQENRSARMFPGVRTDVHNEHCALHVRRWSVLYFCTLNYIWISDVVLR